jgi:hypothetical protein
MWPVKKILLQIFASWFIGGCAVVVLLQMCSYGCKCACRVNQVIHPNQHKHMVQLQR